MTAARALATTNEAFLLCAQQSVLLLPLWACGENKAQGALEHTRGTLF